MTATVTKFPLYNLYNIPEALRKLADEIESGEVDAVRVVVVIEPEVGLDYRVFGSEPFTFAHASGLCHGMANKLILGPE